MTAQPTGAEPRQRAGTAAYVYGLVRQGTELPPDLPAVAAGTVTLVEHGDVAALLSEVPAEAALGTPDDLRAHEQALDAIAARAAVLPMRFGAVVETGAVVDELLAAHHDHFAGLLAEIADAVQFTVRGTYEQDVVLREILAEDPELIRQRDAVRELPGDAGYYERVRLGELVAQALAGKRAADTTGLLDTLEPHLLGSVVHDAVGDDGALDAALLVDRSRQRALEDSVDDLAREWHGRIHLRLLGPLAPYDFVQQG